MISIAMEGERRSVVGRKKRGSRSSPGHGKAASARGEKEREEYGDTKKEGRKIVLNRR